MKDNGSGLALAALAAFLLLRGSSASAKMVSVAEQDTNDAPREADANPEQVSPVYSWDSPRLDPEVGLPSITDWDSVDPDPAVGLPVPYSWETMTPGEVGGLPLNNPDANVAAFLYMIRATEHTFPRDVETDACYNIFYGGSVFKDLSDHPVITGEKKGVPLAAATCRASGLKPGCVSTAAGAYQIIKPTWVGVRDQLPRLPDFSPSSQDEAARRLLDQVGALELIRAGDITGGINRASKLWASLPGSMAKQNPRAIQYALDRFAEGLVA